MELAVELKTLKDQLGEVKEQLQLVTSLLLKKQSRKEWVRISEFMALTGKKRHQVDHICRLHAELKRNRIGEGVQINYKKYLDLYN